LISSKNPIPFLKKEEWLKNSPIYNNTVICDKIYKEDFDLTNLHFHEFIEISIVISGEGFHRVLNKTMPCRSGDIYIINSGVPHGYFAKNSLHMPTVCNLLFEPSDILSGDAAATKNNRYCYGIFTENPLVAYIGLDEKNLEKIQIILSSIHREASKKQSDWQEMVSAFLTTLLILLRRQMTKKNETSISILSFHERRIVSEMLRIIAENYCDSSLTIEKIGHYVSASKSYLSRIFLKVTEEHFSDYIRKIRLNQACRLLIDTNYTNEQIASACGFKDIPTFYKNFKKYFLKTPNEYRQTGQSSQSVI